MPPPRTTQANRQLLQACAGTLKLFLVYRNPTVNRLRAQAAHPLSSAYFTQQDIRLRNMSMSEPDYTSVLHTSRLYRHCWP